MYNKWIKDNNLDCTEITDGIIETPIGVMIWVQDPVGEPLFTDDFELKINFEQNSLAEQSNAKYYLFNFGTNLYYTPIEDIKKPKLNLFKYIGETSQKQFKWPYLGIHGRYELMSGTRDYKDWCNKARFYGLTSLGICEKNTLAGTLHFQLACEDQGLKSILGATYTIERNNTQIYNLKFYVLNDSGWQNLLHLNKIVNVDHVEDKIIPEFELLQSNVEGLVCVIDPMGDFNLSSVINFITSLSFEQSFVQFDTSKLVKDKTDLKKLKRLKTYLDEYIDIIKPILIFDSYYLDKSDAKIRDILTSAGSVKGVLASDDQYFRHLTDVMSDFDQLFLASDERFTLILKEGIKNCKWIESNTEFKINLSNRHLPEYIMTSEEKEKYGNNKKMFIGLIEEGIISRNYLNTYDEEKVYSRLKLEIGVIMKAKVYNYFLITWDMIRYCRENNILTGFGRGSAAGCLISYLMYIIHVDPFEHDLLFERFLNPGRAMKSLPDIDSDIEGLRRDEVKKYLESKYGENRVASIGTFTTLQMRAAMKELNREVGLTDTGNMNYISQIFDGGKWHELFTDASSKPQLKSWIKENGNLVELIPLCYNSPKAASIHACAMVIAPALSEEDDIFKRIPVKKVGDIIVTEWEGGPLEDVGYLKQDVLGIQQLDKFRNILNLIKQEEGIDIDIYSLPLDDPKVYEMFCNGFNKDVFHFGSDTLTTYLRAVKPVNIGDLIAAISLVRPGTMGIGAHTKYIQIREGDKVPEYDFGLEEVTKETFGIYIYQEQVMQAVQVLGGFTLAEADDVRRALGKMEIKYLAPYKEQFLAKAREKGCPPEEAQSIWDKLAEFAKYGFNKSHAAAYSITGYICNWLKAHYPMQFWVTALQYAESKKITGYVNEINKTGSIQIAPPDINKSSVGFIADYRKEIIYWSIDSIKFVGEASVEEVLKIREEVGEFIDLEQFIEKIPTKYANKRVITNMIIAGCFDLTYNLQSPSQRIHVLEELYRIKDIKEKEQVDWLILPQVNYDWWWSLKQHEISGLGNMTYKKVIRHTKKLYAYEDTFKDGPDFYLPDTVDNFVVVGGIITKAEEKKSKRGMMGNITIDCNSEPINIRVWADDWNKVDEDGMTMREEILKANGRILFISGNCTGPSIYNPDNILQTVSRGKQTTEYDIL